MRQFASAGGVVLAIVIFSVTNSGMGQAPPQDRNRQQQRNQQQDTGSPPSQSPRQQQATQRQQHIQRHGPRIQQPRSQQQRRTQQAEQRRVWQQHRARNWDSERRSWQQRGGYRGYRVPDVYFHRYYGPTHWFRIYGLPFMIVGGFPRFQYYGYWFSVLDPYPDYWGDTWYETDDVYVDYYIDGYYLFNRRFPGRPGIAVSIVF